MNHIFNDSEYEDLQRNWMAQGAAMGRAEAKDEMGKVLDLLSNEGRPYRFPVWEQVPYLRVERFSPIAMQTPGYIELTADQLRCIRVLLCGPK